MLKVEGAKENKNLIFSLLSCKLLSLGSKIQLFHAIHFRSFLYE